MVENKGENNDEPKEVVSHRFTEAIVSSHNSLCRTRAQHGQRKGRSRLSWNLMQQLIHITAPKQVALLPDSIEKPELPLLSRKRPPSFSRWRHENDAEEKTKIQPSRAVKRTRVSAVNRPVEPKTIGEA